MSLSTQQSLATIIRAANASLKLFFHTVGGTCDIGQAIVEAFAHYTDANANIVIVGRNRASADRIISSFPKPTSTDVKHQSVLDDASLAKNVAETACMIIDPLPKINYLVMSCGILTSPLVGRTETVEGIDRKLALHYSARWKFIYVLLPSIQKAKDAGEEARVMTLRDGEGISIRMIWG